ASGLGMYPDGLVVLGSAGVLGVVPGIGVAIALDAIDDGMPVTQDLVHVQFDVRNTRCRIGDVNPAVPEEVRGGRIGAKADPIPFPTAILVAHGELACRTAAGRRSGKAHAA